MSRNLHALVAELRQREQWTAALLGEMFGRQRAVYEDGHTRIAMHPGRRGGKSECIQRVALLHLLSAGQNEAVLLGAETVGKAKALFWGQIEALTHRLDLPLSPDSAAGKWATPWGSTLQFVGMKDANRVHLLRGYKVRAALFDEVATYVHLLPLLVDSVLEQALADTGGPLVLAGTPSPTKTGAWYEICSGERRGWHVYHWTVRDNPMFPRDPEAVLAETRERIGGDDPERDPAYQREWMGLFVNDSSQLVYRWDDSVLAELPPHYDPDTWVTVLGVDFGMVDDCAWTVVTAHPHERVAYTIWAEKYPDLLPEGAAEVTARLVERYQPQILVGDAGGLGKPYVEQWNARHAAAVGIPMLAAEKTDKRGQIQLMNGELRAGRLKVVGEFCSPLVQEVSSLPWNEQRTEADPRYPNHCADAWTYSHRHLYHFLHEAPAESLDPRAPEQADAWAQELERIESEEAEELATGSDWEQYG